MIGGAAPTGAEEDQIAALQLAAIDRTGIAQVIHLIGGARNADFYQILIGVVDQPTAVKTGTRRGSAPAIRFANLIH